MVLINIDQLSDSELRYIASQENLEDWESLSRDNLIEALEDFYDEDSIPQATDNSKKFVKTLTDVNSDVLQLPGVEPLPEHFNNNEIHCIAMDANWAYSYWSFTPTIKHELEENGNSLFIRVEELSDSDQNIVEESYDVSVDPEDTSWNIELAAPGKTYRLRLFIQRNENSDCIATSETIRCPQSWIATHKTILRDPDRYKVIVPSLISKEGEIINNKQVRETLSSYFKEVAR